MKILLSAGIQLAQANISVDQAQGLGLITYLSFLKIKTAQQLAPLQKSKNDTNRQIEDAKYALLLDAMDELLHELQTEIQETDSIDVLLQISKSLENNTPLDLKKHWIFNRLLQRINIEAKEFLVEPRVCFMNRIAAMQSLSAISNFKNQLTSQAFHSQNSKDNVLILLNRLQSKPIITKRKAATWQVA
jgi:hypothetical protein